ncbi:hypothetical protein AVEN_64995-1 [Araneus ventricosus]|uniref:RNase H type-1 domain-containing protein n=1 Tax=Araneus ventricosus TaxID=182803 RepID=A0A4Y2LRB9_ARAVE|nr:hypothetical protein AVEN_64995-1 [Araneus ventricosus]
MRLIERQLQTAMNNLVKWCDQNGYKISQSKSCCVHFCRKRSLHPEPEIYIRVGIIPVVPEVRFLGVMFDRKLSFQRHILFVRKKCEKLLNILKVLSNTSWGADKSSLLRIYEALILSRIDYGCIAYGSSSNSALKKLDTVHHSALRICSGAFRTSPVQRLYVVCHQLPLSLRRQKLSLQYYFKILSTTNHPLQHNTVSRFLNRLYNARPAAIRPFMERMKPILSDTHLADTRVLASVPFCFPPWNVTSIAHINPFIGFSKDHADPFIFQQLYLAHRSQYDNYKAIFTDGSKMTDHVGFGVLIDEDTYSHTLQIYSSIFTAEVTAILYALKRISSYEYRNFCLYTDNMSFLQQLQNFYCSCHQVVAQIMVQLSSLKGRGFDIMFCWVPTHVGIKDNELVDSAAKSATIPFHFHVPFAMYQGISNDVSMESGKRFGTHKLTISCIPFFRL